MVKPLAFKGERKSKKRKAPHPDSESQPDRDSEALSANRVTTEAEDDDSWVTAEEAIDIIGPIVLALPTTKPTCLACDANGKIFASELENLIEGDLATAEPHDVRQVWIAIKAAGSNEISFKGHHGRYLSCDKLGLLSATREAVSPEESFLCIPSPATPQTFNIQTVREMFLAIHEEQKTTEIKGDADAISFNTTFRLRVQARFKPRSKANKESKVRERVSRKELEDTVGRKLEEHEVKRLKKARIEGDFHEAILEVRVKGKHDKYS